MTTEEMIALYRAGHSAGAISRMSGVKVSTVYGRMRYAGVRVGPRSRSATSSGYQRAERQSASPAACAIWAAIQAGPATLDDLSDRLSYAPATIATALNALRRLGKVRSRQYVWEVQEPHA